MTENNFHPTPISKRETFGVMKNTLVEGIKLVKNSPVLLTIIVTGLIFGIFSEGFDRLWTPFMIDNFVFPTILNLKPVIWFGILAMVANALAILAVQYAEKVTDTNDHKSTVKTLLIINGLLAMTVIFFGLSGNFMMAIIGYWMVSIFREARGPIYDAWTNQNLKPQIRATVFSMCSQANAVGQIVGGPILGLIATYISLRWSIVLAGAVLIPSLWLYNRSIRRQK